MPRNDATIEIAATLKHETASAYLIDDGGFGEVWVPKSLVEYDGEEIFTMPEWLAMDKGLIPSLNTF